MTRTVVLIVAGVVLAAGAALGASGSEPGSVLAFGSNYSGQLGSTTNNGTLAANPVPARLAAPAGAGAIVQLAAGGNHSLLVTASGQLFALGQNDAGQLGIAPASGTPTPTPAPTAVTLPGEIGVVTQVAAGAVFSLVVTSSGQLYAFGSNQFGQLANTTNNGTTMPNPTPTLVTLPGQTGIISRVSAGHSHSLVLTSSGQLYAFGYNQFGQLGTTTNNNTAGATPTPAPVTLPGQIGTIAQIAAGGWHSLALTSSGQLYAFGWNYYGQVGNATGNGTDAPTPTPTLLTLPGQVGQVTQIAGGGYHSLAATASGQLYAFGGNQTGQLGNATNTGTGNANPVPATVPLAGQVGPVTQIAGGDDHSLVVTSSGQLYSFGSNYRGELGNAAGNGMMTAHPTPALVTLPAGTTIDAVAKGPVTFHSLALVSDLAIVTETLAAAQVGSPYLASLEVSGGTSPLTWSADGLPGGIAIDAARGLITGTPGAAGVSSATVRVTDAYGSSVSRTFALTVTAATSPQPSAVRAPQLEALKQTAGRWRLGSKLPRLVKTIPAPRKRGGVPIGTTFSITLDQPARTTLSFRHTAQGRRVSGKCVARTKANAGKPRCTRTLSDGNLRIQTQTGTNRLRFEGRINATKKLKPGPHSVTITATNTTGKTSPARTLRFTAATG